MIPTRVRKAVLVLLAVVAPLAAAGCLPEVHGSCVQRFPNRYECALSRY